MVQIGVDVRVITHPLAEGSLVIIRLPRTRRAGDYSSAGRGLICLDAATLSPLMHVIEELLEQLESSQRFAEAHAFRRFGINSLRWFRVCLTVLFLGSELTRLRLSPHNRPPAISGGPLHTAAYWELVNWLFRS